MSHNVVGHKVFLFTFRSDAATKVSINTSFLLTIARSIPDYQSFYSATDFSQFSKAFQIMLCSKFYNTELPVKKQNCYKMHPLICYTHGAKCRI